MLPALHYPTTVLLIDDDLAFLQNLSLHLDPSLCYKLFDSAREALSFIHAQQDVARHTGLLDEAVLRVGYHDEQPDLSQRSIHLALNKVHHTIYNPRRFSEIAAIVVDYAMPEMNGLELCTKLTQSSIRRILLTGEADAMVGVEAFNVGLIHHFLKKQTTTIVPQLNLAIAQMRQQHLNSKGLLLSQVLNMADIGFLSDSSFKALIAQLMAQHYFIEYYFLANPDGLLFLRADGSAMRLVVETGAGMQAHIEAAQAGGAPAALLEALQKKQVVPFFWRSGGMYTEASFDWEADVLPAQCSVGQQIYYWGLSPVVEPTIALNKIYTFNDFTQRRPFTEAA
ncbi:response regulator [Parvibium lacunae]|uniref:Response regulator n=1 Tax=Parvibium lacunae TaxID=1888893 RepID=A0A368L092_9BURK|nr:response regulator [Parvibium lacunae]RCS56489.1 response regulator [Parvibium lacunae]